MSQPAVLTSRQRQSRATQDRLLAAASEEFSRYGLAGGRVDRIAAASMSNKRLIYIYFGDKDGLFDAVVARDLEAMLEAVPLTTHDLPGYAAALFDYLEDRPAVLRLYAWRNLERLDVSDRERILYGDKIAQIADGQAAGYISEDTPTVLLLAAVLGVVSGWGFASPALRDAAGGDADRALRRAAVHHAVQRLTSPAPVSPQ